MSMTNALAIYMGIYLLLCLAVGRIHPVHNEPLSPAVQEVHAGALVAVLDPRADGVSALVRRVVR